MEFINETRIIEMPDRDLVKYDLGSCHVRTEYMPREENPRHLPFGEIFVAEEDRNTGLFKQNLKNGLEYIKGRGFKGFVVKKGQKLSKLANEVVASGLKSGWIIEDNGQYFVENI